MCLKKQVYGGVSSETEDTLMDDLEVLDDVQEEQQLLEGSTELDASETSLEIIKMNL